jgi:PAS domain S-box-containing protein
MSRALRVLIVEDRSTDAELMLRELRRSGFDPEWRRVDTEADYVANLSPDLEVILSDYALPAFSGLRALEVLRERGLEIPFIIVSGTIGEDTAVAAMKRGAADYLLKDRLVRLGPAVDLALDQGRLRKEGERAQEAMRQSEHKYRHLFESLSEAAFLIETSSRRIVDANLCAERLLGRTRTEILGMDVGELFPSKKSADTCCQPGDATAATFPDLLEAVLLTNSGRHIPVQISVAPVDLYGRKLVLALMTDITGRKQSEDRLRQAIQAAGKAIQARNDFLANMSHEIRTPMNALIGTLDLLVADEPSTARRESLEIAKSSAVSLLELLSEILSLSSLDTARIQRTDSAFSLGDCLDVHLHEFKTQAAAKGIILTISLAPEIPGILRGDQHRLGQIITRLVSNAIKFTERGHIEVYASVESLSSCETSLLFEVRDSGIGIPSEHQAKIFSPFVQVDSSSTRSHGGVGLGLAIVHRTIEIMGGRIWVESEPGNGSSFFFTLTFGIGIEGNLCR